MFLFACRHISVDLHPGGPLQVFLGDTRYLPVPPSASVPIVKTLKRHQFREFLPYPKDRRRLPAVLSREEVSRLINAAGTLFRRTLLMTLYGTGMRRSELAHLKVSDIDSQRMIIRVVAGKGGKRKAEGPFSPVLLVERADGALHVATMVGDAMTALRTGRWNTLNGYARMLLPSRIWRNLPWLWRSLLVFAGYRGGSASLPATTRQISKTWHLHLDRPRLRASKQTNNQEKPGAIAQLQKH
jgi:integrase